MPAQYGGYQRSVRIHRLFDKWLTTLMDDTCAMIHEMYVEQQQRRARKQRQKSLDAASASAPSALANKKHSRHTSGSTHSDTMAKDKTRIDSSGKQVVHSHSKSRDTSVELKLWLVTFRKEAIRRFSCAEQMDVRSQLILTTTSALHEIVSYMQHLSVARFMHQFSVLDIPKIWEFEWLELEKARQFVKCKRGNTRAAVALGDTDATSSADWMDGEKDKHIQKAFGEHANIKGRGMENKACPVCHTMSVPLGRTMQTRSSDEGFDSGYWCPRCRVSFGAKG